MAIARGQGLFFIFYTFLISHLDQYFFIYDCEYQEEQSLPQQQNLIEEEKKGF